MNKQTLNEFKHLLEQQQAAHKLRANINQNALETVELDQNRMGRLSRMDALQGQQMAQEAERRRLLKLKQIAGALLKIDKDDYGFCYICDNEIQAERLRFDPTITRCINCSEKA